MQHNGARARADAIAEVAAALLLVTALLFGGGSRGWGDLVVHLAAVPALALALLRWRPADATRLQRLFVVWLVAALAVIAVQLLPLPASVIGLFPARAAVLADLRSAGVDPAWMPLSLDPWGTVRALLAFATFASMWLIASTLPAAARRRLLVLAVLVAVPMALLGFAQAAAGTQPTLRFHPFHNAFGATATFANRNHLAALLAMLLPLALHFGAAAHRDRRLPQTAAWYGAVVVLLLGVALTFSRAGLLLATTVLGAAMVFAWHRSGRWGDRRPRANLPLLGALALAAIATVNYAWAGIAARLERDPLGDLRWQYLRHGSEAAREFLPLGSGFGSFRAVYAPFEPVGDMVASYALHAHNDVLELAIEAGVPGLLLAVALVGLLAAALRKVRVAGRDAVPTMAPYALAAGVPLAHSFVDYPLRTLAVAVLFALLLAQLLAPRSPPATATGT